MTSTAKYIVGTLLIFLLGGVVDVAVFCGSCLSEPFFLSRNFFISFCYSGMMWVFMWRGSEFLVDLLDRVVPWFENLFKRLAASLLGIMLLVFISIWILDIFFDTLVFGKSFTEAFDSNNSTFKDVFSITLIMNIFMHGRGFLLSWRQVSVDIERLKTEQISTQYESLKNQVNPHFLFNSLNALASLVYDDQDRAVDFIRKLSEVYRYVLDKKEEEVVTVSDELAFAENFIFLQQIRFGSNLQVTIEGKVVEGYLPPLAIQILLENAIKHNVISEKDPLTICVELDGDFCTVKNNIKEKLDKDSTGIGLNNLIERYKYLTDKEMVISNDGETFIVSLPILKLSS